MRDRGGWSDDLFPFNGTGGRSGALMTVDIDLLTKAGFTMHLQGQRSYYQIRKTAQDEQR